MASKASKAEEFRNEITSKIITALESGTAPWQQPWNGSEAPHNAITRHQYNGINTVILSMAAMSMGVINNDNRWLTFNQASEAGYKIKAGSKGTHVLLWKPTITTDEHGNREITSVLQRTFTVFHASQIEGIPEYVPPEINIIAAHEKAEKIISDSGVRIFFDGGEAYYKPIEDYIQMPPKEDFKSQEGYYSTTLHELCHATGHPSRLNRVQRCGRFSQEYAFEELVAELGSLFIASSAGIPQSETEFQNHASYIESWLKNLRNDNMYIFSAAAEANKAAGYLLKNAGCQTESDDSRESE